jgi:cullin-4
MQLMCVLACLVSLTRCRVTGYQWTNKLEGMFKDVGLSKDLMKSFHQIFENDGGAARAPLDIDLDVNVCTTGYW